jgi:hypothetical protein
VICALASDEGGEAVEDVAACCDKADAEGAADHGRVGEDAARRGGDGNGWDRAWQVKDLAFACSGELRDPKGLERGLMIVSPFLLCWSDRGAGGGIDESRDHGVGEKGARLAPPELEVSHVGVRLAPGAPRVSDAISAEVIACEIAQGSQGRQTTT